MTTGLDVADGMRGDARLGIAATMRMGRQSCAHCRQRAMKS